MTKLTWEAKRNNHKLLFKYKISCISLPKRENLYFAVHVEMNFLLFLGHTEGEYILNGTFISKQLKIFLLQFT